jgi:hypothetical protein
MAKPTLGLPDKAKIVQADTAPAEIPAPYLGASVIVSTSEKISGQSEHAAIVTQVHSDVLVNVMVFPGTGQSYPIASINRASGSPSWRWPTRN